MPAVLSFIGAPDIAPGLLILVFVLLYAAFALLMWVGALAGTRGRGRVLPRLGPLPRAAGPVAVALAVAVWASGVVAAVPVWAVLLLVVFVLLWATPLRAGDRRGR